MLTLIGQINKSFVGNTNESNVESDRYTPTPRRSIHSYKVTETSKETVTTMKDGTVSRNFDYKKETSTNQDEVGGAGLLRRMLRYTPAMFLILIVLAVGYYIKMVSKYFVCAFYLRVNYFNFLSPPNYLCPCCFIVYA